MKVSLRVGIAARRLHLQFGHVLNRALVQPTTQARMSSRRIGAAKLQARRQGR